MVTSRTFAGIGVGVGDVAFIGTATVSGAAATTLTLSGLDLSSYKCVFLSWSFDNATGSSSNLSIYYNADTTATNYETQVLTGNGSSVSSSRANDAFVIGLVANEPSIGTAVIRYDQDGKARWTSVLNRGPAATMLLQIGGQMWTVAGAITGITVSASVASSLAIGSTFSLWGFR
jgi:hypothetical protein